MSKALLQWGQAAERRELEALAELDEVRAKCDLMTEVLRKVVRILCDPHERSPKAVVCELVSDTLAVPITELTMPSLEECKALLEEGARLQDFLRPRIDAMCQTNEFEEQDRMIVEHVLAGYDVKLVGDEAHVRMYREHVAGLQARVAEIESAIRGHVDGDFCSPTWQAGDPLNSIVTVPSNGEGERT